MYTVDLYLRVRLACHVDGLSQREAASRFGIARETVRKMLRHSEPPGYRRRQPPKRPKLACTSHLFHPSQKPWNSASPPDTLSGMHKIIEIFADRAAPPHRNPCPATAGSCPETEKAPAHCFGRRIGFSGSPCLTYGLAGATPLVIVRPETVIGWHRKGFRLFWTWKSRRGKPSRPPVSREIRDLVRRMSPEGIGIYGRPL